MVSLDLISLQHTNTLFSSTGNNGSSASSGFSQLADDIVDQYDSVFIGTSAAGLYTQNGALASGISLPGTQTQSPPRASGLQAQSALAAYQQTSSTASLAASIQQAARTAPLKLLKSSDSLLAQNLNLFA